MTNIKFLKNTIFSTHIMCISSSNMRELFKNSEVKGVDEELCQQIDKFAEISQRARKNAVVFVEHLLPQTLEAMLSIKDIVNEIGMFDGDFEVWKDNLDGFRKRLDDGVKKCDQMIRLYEALIVEFNRCEDEATKDNRLKDLKGLVTTFADKEEKYRKKTREHDDWAKNLALAIPTFGLSTVVAKSLSEKSKKKGDEKEQDKDAATELAYRSEKLLLPAIKEVQKGLHACCEFMIDTQTKIRDTKGVGIPNRKFFQVMQQGAKEIARLCSRFSAKASLTRTNLNTIKYEESDMTYADRWMQEEKEKFEKGGS